MLKLTKKADYALMAMKHLAEKADQGDAAETGSHRGCPFKEMPVNLRASVNKQHLGERVVGGR